MKGLDTPVLLRLLHGDPRVRAELHRLRDTELATTEANLLELAILAGRDRSLARKRREALEQLRHRLTVLPIDARASERLLRRLREGKPLPTPVVLAMLCAFESAGCEEVYTRGEVASWGKWTIKFTQIAQRKAG
jgi:predicted nucleic acid-binding protein